MKIAVELVVDDKGVVQGFQRLAVGSDRAAQSVDRLAQRASLTQRILQGIGQGIGQRLFDGFISGLRGTITGLADLVTGAVGMSIAFETAFANVAKAIDTTDKGELAAFREGILELAMTMPVTPEAIASVEALGSQLGVNKAQIESFTKTIVALGVAVDGMTTEQAATDLAQFANVMRDANWDGMASTLVELGNKGSSTEAAILSMAQRIATGASAMHIGSASAMAMAASVANLGINAEAGGTAVNKMLLSIGKAVDENSSKLATFAKVAGMSAQDFARAWKTDPDQAIRAFFVGLETLEQRGISVTGTLSAMGVTTAQATQTFLALSSAGGLTAQAFDNAAGAYGKANAHLEEARKKFETTANQAQLLSNVVQVAGIKFGDALAPYASKILSAFRPAADALVKLADLFRQDAQAQRVLEMATNGLVATFKVLLLSIGAVIGGFGVFMGSGGATGLVIAIGLVMRATYAAISGFWALAAASAAALGNTNAAMEYTQKSAEALKASMDAPANAAKMSDELRALSSTAERAGTIVYEAAGRIGQAAPRMGNALTDVRAQVKAGVAGVNEDLEEVADEKTLKTLQQQLEDYYKFLSSGLKNFFDELASQRSARETSLFGPSADDAAIEARKLGDALTAIGGPAELSRQQLDALDKKLVELKQSAGVGSFADLYKNQLEAMQTAAARVRNGDLGALPALLQAGAAAAEAMRDAMNLEKVIDPAARVERSLEQIVEQAESLGTAAGWADAVKGLEQLADEADKAGVDSRRLELALRAARQAAGQLLPGEEARLRLEESISTELARQKAEYDAMVKRAFSLDGILQAGVTVLGLMGDGWADVGAGVDRAASGAEQFINATDLSGVIQGLAGIVQGFKAATDSASGFQRALGGAMVGASVGGQIGEAIGGPMGKAIGASLGAAVGAIAGVFRKPGWVKAGESAGKVFGFAVSKELAKEIEATAKKLNVGFFEASLLNIGKAMEESGKPAAAFSGQMVDLMRTIKLGSVPAADGLKALGEAFVKLTEEAKKSKFASLDLFRVMSEARGLGIMSDEMKQFVSDTIEGWGEAAQKAFGTLGDVMTDAGRTVAGAVGGLMILKPEDAVNQATIFGLIWGQTVAEKGLTEAARILGPGFEALQSRLAQHSEQFLEAASAIFAPIAQQFSLASNEMFAGASDAAVGFGEILRGAIETAMPLTMAQFQAFEGTAVSAFEQAKQAGINMGLSVEEAQTQALLAIAPLLQQLVQASAAYGIELDSNTQALIDQAQAAGVAFAASPIDRAANAMERVAEILERVYGFAKGTADELGRAGANAGGIRIPPAPPGGPPDIPGFAGGGIVRRPTLAHVAENGPEAVLTLPQLYREMAGVVSSTTASALASMLSSTPTVTGGYAVPASGSGGGGGNDALLQQLVAEVVALRRAYERQPQPSIKIGETEFARVQRDVRRRQG